MEFFEDLGKRIGEAAKVVEDKSKELVEVGRINIEMGKEEAAIKKLYSQIGQAFYQAYSRDEELGENIIELCNKISCHQSKIEELKTKGENIKAKGKKEDD